jgi:hypothetical protein
MSGAIESWRNDSVRSTAGVEVEPQTTSNTRFGRVNQWCCESPTLER